MDDLLSLPIIIICEFILIGKSKILVYLILRTGPIRCQKNKLNHFYTTTIDASYLFVKQRRSINYITELVSTTHNNTRHRIKMHL